MKCKFLLLLLIVLLIFTLSGCLLQQAGPDPELPQYYRTSAAPSTASGRLIKVEYEELLNVRGTYRHQEYNYDEQGRLMSIYAPDDYLPCVSEIPYSWLLFDHASVIEERYEYDAKGRLIRVTGYLPKELTDNPISHDITITCDETGHVILEELTSSEGRCSVTLEYDGDLVSRVTSSDGRSAELCYSDGELIRIALPDGEITYSREPGEVLMSNESGVGYVDGIIETVFCYGPRAYTEKAAYNLDGLLLYREREYEDDPQNTCYWHYYYA